MKIYEILDIHVFEHVDLIKKKVWVIRYDDLYGENISARLPLKGKVISIDHYFGCPDRCRYWIKTPIKYFSSGREDFRLKK